MKFKLGADPELFMQDASGAFLSAIDKIGGSKKQPRPLPIGDGFAVQEDNVAVEYNIPPSDSPESFVNNIQRAMSYLSDEVAALGARFVNVSATADFPEWQLKHPKAQEFGCDPDFNAWLGGKRNPRPKAANAALRSCGGHVHVGYKFINRKAVQDFTKHLDLFLSVPAQVMDKGQLRKQLYGKAGAFRYKPYGMEYRSLSNFWVFTPEHTEWVWKAVDLAMNAWQDGSIDIDSEAPRILEAINNNNMQATQTLISKHNLLVV